MLDRIIGKHGLDQLCVAMGAESFGVTGHPVALLNRQLEQVGDRLEAVSLLVDGIGKLLGQFREAASCRLLAEFGTQLLTHGLERTGALSANVADLDDVEAEVGANHFTDLTLGLGESRILERLHHHPAAEVTQVATTR